MSGIAGADGKPSEPQIHTIGFKIVAHLAKGVKSEHERFRIYQKRDV